MRKSIHNFCILIILILVDTSVSAEILKKLEITGNQRISLETIQVYGEIEKGKLRTCECYGYKTGYSKGKAYAEIDKDNTNSASSGSSS